MNRTLVLLLAVSLMLVARTSLAADWPEVKSYEGNFKALLPSDPEYSGEPIEGIENSTLHMFVSDLEDGALAYIVLYNDYPSTLTKSKPADQILDDACDGAQSTLTAPETTKTKVMLAGHPGRDLDIKATKDGKDTYVAWRAYLVDNRLYQTGIVRIGKPIDEADKKKFFDSFELLKK